VFLLTHTCDSRRGDLDIGELHAMENMMSQEEDLGWR
jgi:hypothetical protein